LEEFCATASAGPRTHSFSHAREACLDDVGNSIGAVDDNSPRSQQLSVKARFLQIADDFRWVSADPRTTFCLLACLPLLGRAGRANAFTEALRAGFSPAGFDALGRRL